MTPTPRAANYLSHCDALLIPPPRNKASTSAVEEIQKFFLLRHLAASRRIFETATYPLVATTSARSSRAVICKSRRQQPSRCSRSERVYRIARTAFVGGYLAKVLSGSLDSAPVPA